MSAEQLNTPLDFALAYAQAGYRVIPVNGKIPLTAHGSHDATTDGAMLSSWWQTWPDANLGITLEGLVVVDVDPRNGGDVDALPHPLPDTCYARTGGGGFHYLYRASNGTKYPGTLGAGIDVKSGPGAYIVVEPSLHASGEKYCWLDETEPWTTRPAEAPEWLARPPGSIRTENTEAAIPEGGRNAHLTSLAGTMRRRGMTTEAILAALLAENAARCNPPLADSEVKTIAASVSRYDAANVDPTQDHKPFPRLNFEDLQLNRHVDYLVKDLLERGTNATIYGPSGDGKTFFCIDLVLHIACGIPWRGRRIQQALVVYVASEAGASIARRFVAWREQKKGGAAGPTPLVVLTQGPNLLRPADVGRLLLDLKAISEEWGMPIGLVVFDTQSRSTVGGDENTSKDMSMVTQAADMIRDAFGAASLFVHHTGKDVSRGQRGASSLPAANDVIIQVVDRCALVEKSRDGTAGAVFAFDLRVVDLGVDQDGDAITTCVVEPTDAGPAAQAKPKRRLPAGAQVALDALRLAIENHGERMPETSALPKGVRAVRLERWHDAYAGMRQLPNDLPTTDARKERNARRMAFQRALDQLQAARVVGTGTGFWWIS